MKKLLLLTICSFVLHLGCNTTVGHSNANPGKWILRNGVYQFSSDGLSMSVDMQHGGRIVSFMVQGREILHTSGEMSGSTFWPSPQQTWDWPPPEQIDSGLYRLVTITDSTLVIESQKDNRTAFIVSKTFRFLSDKKCFNIIYGISNVSSGAVSVAPWEITRVPSSGVIFFPKESDFKYVDPKTPELLPTLESADEAWFSLSGLHDYKAFRDGSKGWIAYSRGDIVLVKDYRINIPVPSFAPGESEIEVYSASTYAEIEQQGEYRLLQSQESLTWEVNWYGRTKPAGMSSEAGSEDLFSYVANMVLSSEP